MSSDRRPGQNRYVTLCCVCALILTPLGCCASSYMTPARGVSMATLADTDEDIRERMLREPATPFPARMATVRVQAPRYRSNSTESYGYGRYSVVTTREIERDEDFLRLGQLPKIDRVAPLNRMVIPTNLQSVRQLRLASASLKADLVLAYSVDTVFRVGEHDFGPLRLISLGMLPTKEAVVTATASCALFDVRTGYVYGLAESTAREKQIASTWTKCQAVESARQKAERKAFEQMLGEFEKTWQQVVGEYGVTKAGTKSDSRMPAIESTAASQTHQSH
jgi:hypothetical protein